MTLAMLAPQIALGGTLVGLLFLGAARVASSSALRWIGVAALACALAVLPEAWDGPARLWNVLFFVGAIPLLAVLPDADEVPVVLILATVLGMSLIAVSRTTVGLFLGLELMSLPAYLMVYTLRRTPASLEAAVKYFFAGGTAGALFVLGAALAYSATGSLEIEGAAGAAATLGLALMAAAALFKMGVVPLHFWLPDAYEAARPELVGFLSTSMKAAAVLLLLRVLAAAAPASPVLDALPALAALTMTVGNLLAFRQNSLQRLLAYSSISHAGYLLLGVAAWSRLGASATGMSSVYFYLAAYLAMNTGAFLVLRFAGLSDVKQLKGYASLHPGTAAFFAVMLVSLAGLPPTAGFLAKLFVFWDAVKAGLIGLVVVAALNTLLGLAYYFRLVRTMYFEEPEGRAPESQTGALSTVLLWACAIPTVLFGLLPGAAEFLKEALAR